MRKYACTQSAKLSVDNKDLLLLKEEKLLNLKTSLVDMTLVQYKLRNKHKDVFISTTNNIPAPWSLYFMRTPKEPTLTNFLYPWWLVFISTWLAKFYFIVILSLIFNVLFLFTYTSNYVFFSIFVNPFFLTPDFFLMSTLEVFWFYCILSMILYF